MTLDQIEKSRAQCINDWADRCKVILALARLGATDWLVRLLEREFDHINHLSQAFSEVGIDDFEKIFQVTLDLSVFIFEKYCQETELTSVLKGLTNSGDSSTGLIYLPAIIEEFNKRKVS